jgi:excisionase family DNA binding protein
MEKLVYSIPEVAELLGISVPTAYALIKTKDFPVLHIGKRKVVPKQGLEEWIKQNTAL